VEGQAGGIGGAVCVGGNLAWGVCGCTAGTEPFRDDLASGRWAAVVTVAETPFRRRALAREWFRYRLETKVPGVLVAGVSGYLGKL
jgi:hypothetical protein